MSIVSIRGELTVTADIRRLYLFHFFNSIAISVAASYVFLDKIMLRMELNMQQFGLVKGVAWFIPMLIGWLLSPIIQRFNRDREIVAISYILRVSIPFCFLFLQNWSESSSIIIGSMVILLCAQIFPIIANNSLQVLIKTSIPEKVLGKHLSKITVCWLVPSMLTAIPCSYYLDIHSQGSDGEFFGAYLKIMLFTTVFQLAASAFILKVNKYKEGNKEVLHHDNPSWFSSLIEPFRYNSYRSYLIVVFIYGILYSMVISFINPYLIEIRGLSLTKISSIGAIMALFSIGFYPYWGNIADKHSGKFVFQVGILGLSVGIFLLSGSGAISLTLFSLFAWNLQMGFFGSGTAYAQQHLSISFSNMKLRNIYLATSTFVMGIGWLSGSLLGGNLLEWLKSLSDMRFISGIGYFRFYFVFCGIQLFIFFVIISLFWKTADNPNPMPFHLRMYVHVRNNLKRIR